MSSFELAVIEWPEGPGTSAPLVVARSQNPALLGFVLHRLRSSRAWNDDLGRTSDQCPGDGCEQAPEKLDHEEPRRASAQPPDTNGAVLAGRGKAAGLEGTE
jgi:hypothetical protein